MSTTPFSKYKLATLPLLVAAILPALGQAQTITYAGPLVITQGGTYTGNYQSQSSGTPCVLVNTNQPVILDGCNLQGPGNLIQSGTGANLTVRNCRGTALAPTVDGQPAGHFLDTYQSQNLVVEHNYFSGTTGITVNRWTGGSGTLTVRYNQARNIDGRWRNNSGSTRSSFLQLNTVTGLAGVEIAYNEVINTPNQSLVEDNINFYNSSGTASSPLRVHDNFVRGAYPYPATAATFTGTGLTTDGDATTLGTAAGYIEASNNQFVSTCNAAMNIAAGHDVYYHDNRMVTSALLADGTRLNATYAATAVFNYYNQVAGIFFNNRIANNTIGYVRWGANNPYPDRQDLSPNNCATCTGVTSLPNPITVATEDNEYTLWQQKVQQAGVTLGPLGAVPAPTPTPPASTGSIANAGFEVEGPTQTPSGWQTTASSSSSANADYTETWLGAHTGTYHLTHYRTEAYEVYTYQTVTGLANGIYTLSVWTRGGSAPTAQLQAKNYGGSNLSTTIGASPNGWVQVSVPNIQVRNGQCEIGVYTKGNAGTWMYFDDFTLTPTNTPPTVALTASATALTLGQTVSLNATAADTDGSVAKVEFYVGTTKLGETSTAPYRLSWTPTAAGTYALTAVATDNQGATTTSAAASVAVTAPPAPTLPPVATGGNLVVNPSFEADGQNTGTPAGWQKQVGSGTNNYASYAEHYGNPHGGDYHGTHYRPEGYEVYTYQVINNLTPGTYRLRAWVKGGGGQQTAQMLAKNYGGPQLNTNLAAISSNDWTQVEIAAINVTGTSAEIGFYSKANGGQWLYFDDVELVAVPTTSIAANAVLNASFDDDNAALLSPSQWTTKAGSSPGPWVSYTEAWPGAHTGTYHLTHYSPLPYEVYTYQVVKNLPAGTYTLKAWVKGGGSRICQLQASNYGGPALATDIPASPSQWTQVSLTGVIVSNGQCEIGFYSKAPAGQWLYFDDIELVRQETSFTASNLASLTASSSADLALYPNPANSQTTITSTFVQAGAVTITVVDYQGTQLMQYQQSAVAGGNEFALDTSALPSGTYTVRLASASQPVQVLRLSVVH